MAAGATEPVDRAARVGRQVKYLDNVSQVLVCPLRQSGDMWPTLLGAAALPPSPSSLARL